MLKAVESNRKVAAICRELGRLVARPGTPRAITLANGSDYTSVALGQWEANRGVELRFDRSGKPTDNPVIGRVNGKPRDECLNESWSLGVEDARRIIEAWRIEYNEERPHMSLGLRLLAELMARWLPPAPAALQTPSEASSPLELS